MAVASVVEPPVSAQPLVLDGESTVTLREFWSVSSQQTDLQIGNSAYSKIGASRAFLDRLTAERRRVYGVTTGYGPLASRHIDPEQSATLQRNLIYHLASGVGPPLSIPQTRALVAARIVSLSKGCSAIRLETLQALADGLNRGFVPYVPSMGTVGASGDLTPLAHVALSFMGQGEAFWNGRKTSSLEALRSCGLAPLTLAAKEGLALVNGTSAMTALAARNGILAERACALGLALGAAYAEVLSAHAEAFEPEFGMVRPHPGQQKVHAALSHLLAGSQRLQPATNLPPVLSQPDAAGLIPAQPLLQDPYSIRCLPQIYGAIADVLSFHNRTVEIELNSVTDNPIFLTGLESGPRVLHGGNFYGQHIAFASDALMPAIVKLAVHAERKVARLTDPLLNGGLPAFLQPDRNGLQSGFMGAQVTASAVLAEMRTEAIPASIQSIPTNANNQDVVPLGTIAARKVSRALGHLFQILSIDALVCAQAVDLVARSTGYACFSASTRRLLQQVRDRVPFLGHDRPLYSDIATLSEFLESEDWPKACQFQL